MVKKPLFYAGFGSGVGGAVVKIINGQPFVLATEFGHAMYETSMTPPPVCGCGGIYHLEAHIGGINIKQRHGCKAYELPLITRMEYLSMMAIGTRNLHMSFPDISTIVFGGGVALDLLGNGTNEPNAEQMAHRTYLGLRIASHTSPVPVPSIRYAVHGDNAGLIGAAYAARQLAT